MSQLVVIIPGHKTSLPPIHASLAGLHNYFRWFMVVYFGMVSPLHKCSHLLVILLLPKKLISCGCMWLALSKISMFPALGIHNSCLFITSSRIRSFIIVHLTFVSVCYHKKWFEITSLKFSIYIIDICWSDL